VKANVVIVEDDPLVAAHVGRGVEAHDGLSLVAMTGTLAGARALLDRKVDLFILDLGLPDGSGIELIEEIRARGGLEPKILVLSVLGDQDTVLAAVLAGADGYLLKDIDSLDIGQQAADALTGGAPLSPSIAAYVLRHLRRQREDPKPEDTEAPLSPREIELLSAPCPRIQQPAGGHRARDFAAHDRRSCEVDLQEAPGEQSGRGHGTRLSQRAAALVNLPRLTGWRRALAIILGAQLLFWGAYALIVAGLQPAGTLEPYRLPTARVLLAPEQGKAGAYATELSGPALLRIPGWQPVVLYPGRASLLTRDASTTGNGWSLTCFDQPCPKAARAYAGPFDHMGKAADWEKFQRFDMVWLVVATELMMGAALLVLLPVNRFSRLQGITGLLLILVGVDAWLTTFGAESLPFAWFPLLRYGAEYLMLTTAALAVNAFADWRPREARAACGCFILVFAMLLSTLIAGVSFATIVPWLDAVTLNLLLGYGVLVLLRMGRTTPGPAIRVLAILLVALASIAFDLFFLPPPTGFALQASVLAPPLTMFGILFEIALQGHRLNQEAEEARSDLERQVLEQDASLLRSSQVLRHQERLIAIDAERQRLLRDMHDGVGGVLTHLLLDVRENRLTGPEIELGLQSAVDDLRNMASAIDAGNEPDRRGAGDVPGTYGRPSRPIGHCPGLSLHAANPRAESRRPAAAQSLSAVAGGYRQRCAPCVRDEDRPRSGAGRSGRHSGHLVG
jgi:DNA-binding NarL/FixJ family response regulator/signal transduction histidine kinase